MLDFYVPATLPIFAPLFGRLAATPSGIFQLAAATETPIVPMCVVTEADGSKTVEIDSLLQPASSVLESATMANARVEAMVRRHAASWGVWPSLVDRWKVADSALPASYEIGVPQTVSQVLA